MKRYLVESIGYDRRDDRAAEYSSDRAAIRAAAATWEAAVLPVREVRVLDPHGEVIWSRRASARFKGGN